MSEFDAVGRPCGETSELAIVLHGARRVGLADKSLSFCVLAYLTTFTCVLSVAHAVVEAAREACVLKSAEWLQSSPSRRLGRDIKILPYKARPERNRERCGIIIASAPAARRP